MLKLEAFTYGNLQTIRTFLVLSRQNGVDLDGALTAVEGRLSRPQRAADIPTMPCPDCSEKMILKRADDDDLQIVVWECPSCLFSKFEPKTLTELLGG